MRGGVTGVSVSSAPNGASASLTLDEPAPNRIVRAAAFNKQRCDPQVVGQRQHSRPGHLVDFTRMAGLDQRSDCYLGDVIDIDEGLGCIHVR